MSLGAHIRKLRDERELSLRAFAKKLGCSAPFVSDIELGRRYPSDKVLAEMARVLGTTVDDLSKYDIRPPTEEMKRLVAINPAYALAFRAVINQGVPPEQLMGLARKSRGNGRRSGQ